MLLALALSTLAPSTVAAGPAQSSSAEVVSSALGERGTWRVQTLGSRRFLVSWTSRTRLPVTSDRPEIVGPADLAFDVSTVDADGRTVRATVSSPTRPDTDKLDVVLSGDRLDVSGHDRFNGSNPRSGTPLDLPGTQTLAHDPGTPGPYGVVTSNYRLDPVALPSMREPIEMVGHVVEPTADAATGPRPLVLFLHGRHGVCYRPGKTNAWSDAWPCRKPFREIPSHLGYDYTQQVLASQGYTTVSVRVNGINAQDEALADGGAGARAAIVQRHLDHWVDLATAHQVDLDRVMLVGHSRGGEGVDRAAIEIPLTAPYRIVGQVLIAPTDFASQTAPYIPTVTLLPSCDGDVSDLQGQRFTDSSRDLTAGDSSLKSTVLVVGANHNYFNTEWTPRTAAAPAFDDWFGDKDSTCGAHDPQRLSSRAQRAVGAAYVAGAVDLFTGADATMVRLFDGSRARVASQGNAQTLSHALGGGRELRLPGLSTTLTLPSGARTRFCQGAADAQQVSSCSYRVNDPSVMPSWPDARERAPSRPFFEMSWTSTGQSGGLALDQPLDLTGRRLELRTIVDPRAGSVDLRVRLTDTAGRSALLTPIGGGVLPGIGDGPQTRNFWAQVLAVDPSAVAGPDLGRISGVDLVSASPSGRIWVADLASAPAALTDVPRLRLPVIRLSRLSIDEGDGPGSRTARVPFTVVGQVTQAARFAVLTRGQSVGDVQRFMVDVAPGQTSGSIPVGYTPNLRDDPDEAFTQITAWPVRGVMTGRYLGDLTVLDDDPEPSITVRPLHRQILEGQPARWRITLDRSVGYDLFLGVEVIHGTDPAVGVADVPQGWLAQHAGEVDTTLPLWEAGLFLDVQVGQGRRSAVLTIPTRRDSVTEPPESLSVRLSKVRFRATSTVTVVDTKS